nr:polysaccharide pyruvyl transferase family protein [uncultured Blautia sp.]
MKIGVITFFNYCNFGAALQCYGLSETLKKEGHEVEYIDYTCPFIGHPFRLSNIRKRGLFGYIYTVAGNIFYYPRRKKFAKFREKIAHTAPVTPGNISEYEDCYDRYITGSDQIWNVKLTDFDGTYFLDFVKDNAKKTSYAASFGGNNIRRDRTNMYRHFLKQFDRISVRESYGADLVKELTGREAEVTLDPTLLLERQEWEKVASPAKRKKPYILVYQLGFSGELIQTVKRVKKETGLPVVYVPFPLGGFVAGKYTLSLGPAEWLALFRDASYVVTDSYHGIIFSLIFERKFLVIADGQHRNQRVISLLERLGIRNRVVGENMADMKEDIDYRKVKAILEEDRQDSLKWIRENI